MSSAIVMQHRRILMELCTPSGFEQALTPLSPEAREAYRSLDPLTWLGVDVAEQVFVLAARHLGRDAVELHETVSRQAVEHTLKAMWRFVLRLVSDDALIARAERIYAKAFQRGHLTAKMLEPGRAEIRVHGWHDMPEFSLRGLRVAIETVLQLSGRKTARLSLQRHPQGPTFIAIWTV